MREISAALITKSVARMCIEANCYLPEDVRARLEGSLRDEPWPIAQEILTHILQNAEMAAARPQPICQDTGMACVFVELGQDVHVDGDLAEAIHEGVRRGYTDGYLRKSVVRDPLDRVNTGDNTPAMIYYEIVPGDQLKITIAPKGFGSENMSRIQMLRPSDGVEGVKKFVLDAVEQALSACGLDGSAFAAFVRSPREDGGADYGLRYEELTALCIRQIQRLAARVKRLEGNT